MKAIRIADDGLRRQRGVKPYATLHRQRPQHLDRVLNDAIEARLNALQAQFAALGAGQRQQALDQRLHARAGALAGFECLAIVLAAPFAHQCPVELRHHRCDRCPQLMRRIRRELTLPLDRIALAVEGLVERVRHLTELGFGPVDGDTRRQIAFGHSPRRLVDALDRRQRAAGERPRHRERGGDADDGDSHHRCRQRPQLLPDVTDVAAGEHRQPAAFVELAGGAALNNTFISNHYSPEDDAPEVKAFVEAYKAEYNGETPDAMAVLGYDGMKMLADAIKRAGEVDSVKIKDALAATKDLKLVTGTVSLNENHDPVKSAVVLEYVDGKQTFKTKVDPK